MEAGSFESGAFEAGTAQPAHPVSLSAPDARRGWRRTVAFCLFLGIPHSVWFVVWSIATLFVAFVGWIWALCRGRLPAPLYRCFCSYTRYVPHFCGSPPPPAEPYPSFSGR